jgi:hypothetical protein
MKICPVCRRELGLCGGGMGIPYRWKCYGCMRVWQDGTNEELIEVEPDNRCPVPECEHLEIA